MVKTYQTVVINGASSGIGAALALQFAGPGVHLGLLGRNHDRLNLTAANCRERGAIVNTGAIDVEDRNSIEEWLHKFDDEQPVDLVIANAGITYPLPRNILHEPLIESIKVMNVNYVGTMNTIMPVLDRMRARGRGHIAVMSSLAAWHGIPAFPAYSASKAAVLNYFQAIRSRLAVAGIDLTIVCPGYIQTPMTESLSGMKMMVMPVDKAAKLIKRGIERKKPLLVFPLPLRLGLWVLNMLPVSLNTRILVKWFGLKK